MIPKPREPPLPDARLHPDCPTCGQPESAPSISLLASFMVVSVQCKVSVKEYSIDPEETPVASPQTGGLRVVTSDVAELKRQHREHAKCKVQECISSDSTLTLHHVINPWQDHDAECDCPTCGSA